MQATYHDTHSDSHCWHHHDLNKLQSFCSDMDRIRNDSVLGPELDHKLSLATLGIAMSLARPMTVMKQMCCYSIWKTPRTPDIFHAIFPPKAL
ncbi:hypothetical protein SERLADRAFT_467505 [Serpula lacrymans var. lacrymans S7.9]|nr:uncharacterized protein SERLADRAFT_467505 [Serpula lacrymans var. lacrymans S7.9]EGO24350.1 hypothetical protein SERLADRAFT_467505 [Serpula lacrymans var. lacrymans S7.9]